MTAFARFYGAGPVHLVTVTVAFLLAAATVHQVGIAALWNPNSWWQSIGVWFLAAVIVHDAVLYPLYSLADRAVVTVADRTSGRRVPVLGHIRVPALGAALTLLVFAPSILGRDDTAIVAATGFDREPYLVRWLLLSAVMFGVSALIYGVRVLVVARSDVGNASQAPSVRGAGSNSP